MSIRHIVTRGLGNGNFLGTIKDVVLRGFGIGTVVITPGLPEGALSPISNLDTGASSSISASLSGAISLIEQNFGTISPISSDDTGLNSSINDGPTGAESKMQ